MQLLAVNINHINATKASTGEWFNNDSLATGRRLDRLWHNLIAFAIVCVARYTVNVVVFNPGTSFLFFWKELQRSWFCVCIFFFHPRWDPVHMVGWPGQREALLLGGLGARHPEVRLWHRQELHGPQVRLQLRCWQQTMVRQRNGNTNNGYGFYSLIVFRPRPVRPKLQRSMAGDAGTFIQPSQHICSLHHFAVHSAPTVTAPSSRFLLSKKLSDELWWNTSVLNPFPIQLLGHCSTFGFLQDLLFNC